MLSQPVRRPLGSECLCCLCSLFSCSLLCLGNRAWRSQLRFTAKEKMFCQLHPISFSNYLHSSFNLHKQILRRPTRPAPGLLPLLHRKLNTNALLFTVCFDLCIKHLQRTFSAAWAFSGEEQQQCLQVHSVNGSMIYTLQSYEVILLPLTGCYKNIA